MTCKLTLYSILRIDAIHHNPSNTILTLQILPTSNCSVLFVIIHAINAFYEVCAFSVISSSQVSGLLKDGE